MSFDSLNLGHKLEPGMSVEDQLVVSGLDWQVHTSYQQTEFKGLQEH